MEKPLILLDAILASTADSSSTDKVRHLREPHPHTAPAHRTRRNRDVTQGGATVHAITTQRHCGSRITRPKKSSNGVRIQYPLSAPAYRHATRQPHIMTLTPSDKNPSTATSPQNLHGQSLLDTQCWVGHEDTKPIKSYSGQEYTCRTPHLRFRSRKAQNTLTNDTPPAGYDRYHDKYSVTFLHPGSRPSTQDIQSHREITSYIRKLKEEEGTSEPSIPFISVSPGTNLAPDNSMRLGSRTPSPGARSLTPGAGERSRAFSARQRLHAQSDLSPELSEEHRQKRLSLVFRVTKVICAWCRMLRERSMELSQVTGVTQLYFYSADGSGAHQNGTKLAFDKSDFSRSKGVNLSLAVRKIALQLPHTRSDGDVRTLYKILNSLHSFKDRFPESIKWQLARQAWYMSCEKGRVILRQGHLGLNFYFIYSGSVFVQLESEDAMTGEKKLSVESIMTTGQCFGELALLEEKGRRTVSVICHEATELFQIERDAFRHICSGLFMNELNEKISLVGEYPLFRHMPSEVLNRLCFESLVISVPIGKVIERDWSKAKHVYIVTEGHIELLCNLDTTCVSMNAHRPTAPAHPSSLLTHLSYWTREQYNATGAQTETSRKHSLRTNPQKLTGKNGISHSELMSCRRSGAKKQKSSGTTRQFTQAEPKALYQMRSSHVEHLVNDCSVEESGFSHKDRQHYLSVGTLNETDITDLRVLDARACRQMETVIMVSQGCKVLRMSRSLIEKLLDKQQIEDFLKKYIPPQIPDKNTRMQKYLRIHYWNKFRDRVTDTLAQSMRGEYIALIPESRKTLYMAKSHPMTIT